MCVRIEETRWSKGNVADTPDDEGGQGKEMLDECWTGKETCRDENDGEMKEVGRYAE